MPALTRWPVPPEISNYLMFLTPERNGKIYYTKYIVNKIGELDLAKNVISEWPVPANLLLQGFGDPMGIVYGPDGNVWFALERGCKIVRFNPAAGTFVGYGLGGQMGYPIPFPRFIRFDPKGNIWYTGMGKTGGLIGRLTVAAGTVGYWDLPASLWTPEGLWVDGTGQAWFTPLNANNGAAGASFGMAKAPATVVQWTIPPGPQPIYPGIVTDAGAENVWFTYDVGQGIGPLSMRVFRFHTMSGTCFAYPHPANARPRKIVLNPAGDAWLTDWSGRVSTIKAGSDCGRIEIARRSVESAWKRATVKMFRGESQPKRRRIRPSTVDLKGEQADCYLEYAIPPAGQNPSIPNGIVYQDAGVPCIYFTDFGLNQICRLT